MADGFHIENKLREINFLNSDHMYKTFFVGIISGESKLHKDRTYLFRTHGKIIGLNFVTEKEDLMFDTVVRSIEVNSFSVDSMKNIDAIIRELENDNLKVKLLSFDDKIPVYFDLDEQSLGCRIGAADECNGIFEVMIGAVDNGIFSDAFIDYSVKEVSRDYFKSLFLNDFSLDEALERRPIFISKGAFTVEER